MPELAYPLKMRKNLKMKYVVIDKDTLYNSSSLQVDNIEDTFMYKAYVGQVNDLKLVYQSNE